MRKFLLVFVVAFLVLAAVSHFSADQETGHQEIDRLSSIPADAITSMPEGDMYPPILYSDEFLTPVPVEAISSAGVEDSPFIPADRDELYFFFTPDVRVLIERQISDGVTGIYVSRRGSDGEWQEPERVWLQRPGKLSLDGCEFVSGDSMLLCTVREGYIGLHWFSAERQVDDTWNDWQPSDLLPEYEVGELHVHGDELYYHSARAGGQGENDIWRLTYREGEWRDPENVTVVNSSGNDGWPYVSSDGSELWFLRTYLGTPAIFRSRRGPDGEWKEPEMIVSRFAGEPTLDRDGNLYFVHHYYRDGVMLEADIYMAKRK
ncbi:MAG: hypothetical protein AUJ19_00405 [Parcubacteria group bacterium CG1_02_58_44]|nr:MAG: hypothetical protein AUJ19_00405 [Parcubacteria group bacterium CG1_02_58_44]